jgi:ankyrin repeat protein
MNIIAAARSNDLRKIRELIAQNVDINIRDEYSFTALIWACSYGYVDIAKELIDAGADLDNSDTGGRTALIWASYYGHLEIVQNLIANGANSKTQDCNGLTAYRAAKERNHRDIALLFARKINKKTTQNINEEVCTEEVEIDNKKGE